MEYLLIISILGLIISFGLTLSYVLRASKNAESLATRVLYTSGLLLLLYFILRFFELGYFPLRTLKDSMVFLSLVIVLVNVAVVVFARLYVINLVLMPFASLILLGAFMFGENTKPIEALVYLRSGLAVLHIPIFILGYVFFILSAVLSVFYLIMDREIKRKDFTRLSRHFPPLLGMDQYIHNFIWLGFIFLTLGILTGFFYAMESGVSFVIRDPKVAFAFVLWIYYVIYIHNRLRGGWVGKRTCYAALVGCGLMLVGYFSANIFFVTEIHGFR
jgi:ABC-type uncharacterized transport system permease subunit